MLQLKGFSFIAILSRPNPWRPARFSVLPEKKASQCIMINPYSWDLSGDSLGEWSKFLPPLELRPMEQSMPSTAWLMPYSPPWQPDDILVSTPSANYTLKDYKRFFTDITFIDGFHMREDTANLVEVSTKPLQQLIVNLFLNKGEPERPAGFFPVTWF